MEFLIRDENGVQLDSMIEIVGNSIVLQSRGGTKGTDKAKNTDYSIALRLLIARFKSNKDLFVEAWVDSNKVQDIPTADRTILHQAELTRSVGELFTLVSRRMQAVGKPLNNQRNIGNANKRLRFTFWNASSTDLVQIANGVNKVLDSDQINDLSTEELHWVEGNTKLVSHLKRERARGLSSAKKADFIQKHGRLFCEICQLDPVAFYKTEAAAACIEVHHNAIAISEMAAGHTTKLDDLQCLCANCHRFFHADLKTTAANADKSGTAVT